MTTASITLYIGTAEYEFDAEGHTYAERYEGTWCDGPEMIEVEDVSLTWAHTGNPVKKQFLNFITAKQWDDITDALAEAHGSW